MLLGCLLNFLILNALTLNALTLNATGWAQDDPETAASFLIRAEQCYNQGNLDQALEYAKKAEEEVGEQPDPWILTAKIYLAQAAGIQRYSGFAGFFRRDLLGEAEESLRTALAIEPTNIAAMSHLSFTLLLLKNIPAARDQAQAALALDPENAYTHYLLGEIGLLVEEPDTAIAAFRKSLAIDAAFTVARAGLIRALTAAKLYVEAAEVTLVLFQGQDVPAEALALAYGIFEPSQQLTQARDLYQRLLKETPERVDILFQLGRVEYSLKAFNDARDLFDRLLQKDPVHEGALYYKGCLLIIEDRPEEASTYLLQVAKKGGSFFPATMVQLHRIALQLVTSYRYEEALALFARILTYNPMDRGILSDRALTLSRSGQTERADQAYLDLLAFDPWDSAIVNNYALHLMGTGRPDPGVEMLRKAISIDDNPDALENLGSFYFYEKQDFAKALDYFEAVLRQDPERSKSLVMREIIIVQG